MHRTLAESVERFGRGIAMSTRPEDRVLASKYLAALAPVLARRTLGEDVLQELPDIERLFGTTWLVDQAPFEPAFEKWRIFRQEYETFIRSLQPATGFDDLHDAVLAGVTIDVDAKQVILRLDPIEMGGSGERVELVAHDWNMFSCPRHDPWGHSTHWWVNQVMGPWDIGSGMNRLVVEMQSGDSIELQAMSIERINVPRAG